MIKKAMFLLGIIALSFFIASCKEKVTITSISVNPNDIDSPFLIDEFSIEDLILEVKMSNGELIYVPITESMISTQDQQKLLSVGNHSITVTYKGFITTFQLTLSYDELTTQLRLIYDLAVQAQATTLTYEQWIASIKGDDGREVELRVDEQFIQWRFFGESTWTNLISLESLRGPSGKSAYEIFISYYPNYPGDEKQWIIDLSLGLLGSYVYENMWITFETNDGEMPNGIENIISVKDFIFLSQLPIPTKEGSFFNGWYLDEDFTTKLFLDTPIMENITVYANWIEIDQSSYEITIMMWSGDGIYYQDIGSHDFTLNQLTGQNMAMIYAVAKAFKELYPNVSINFYGKPGGPDDGGVSWNQSRINFKNTFGHYPMIFASNSLFDDVINGRVADLSIYSEDSLYQSFNPAVMSMMNYYGVQAGLPQYLLPWGVYVNKQLAIDHQISVPSYNWDIDDYTNFVSQADGVNFWGAMETPFSFIFTGTTTMAAQLHNYSGTGNRINANSAEVRALIPYINQWANSAIWTQRDLGNVPDQVMNDNWWWGFKFFMENKILTLDGDPWMMGDGAHPDQNHWGKIKSNDWDIYPRPATPYQGNTVGVALDPLAIYNFALSDGNNILSEDEAKHQAMAYRFASFMIGDDRAWTARAEQMFLDGETPTSAMNDSFPLVTGDAFDRQMNIWFSVSKHQRFANSANMPGFHEVLRLFEAGQIHDVSDKTYLWNYNDGGTMRPILYEWHNMWNPAVVTGNQDATSPRRTDANWVDTVLSKLPQWNTLFNQRYALVDTSLRQALQTYYGKTESDFS